MTIKPCFEHHRSSKCFRSSCDVIAASALKTIGIEICTYGSFRHRLIGSLLDLSNYILGHRISLLIRAWLFSWRKSKRKQSKDDQFRSPTSLQTSTSATTISTIASVNQESNETPPFMLDTNESPSTKTMETISADESIPKIDFSRSPVLQKHALPEILIKLSEKNKRNSLKQLFSKSSIKFDRKRERKQSLRLRESSKRKQSDRLKHRNDDTLIVIDSLEAYRPQRKLFDNRSKTSKYQSSSIWGNYDSDLSSALAVTDLPDRDRKTTTTTTRTTTPISDYHNDLSETLSLESPSEFFSSLSTSSLETNDEKKNKTTNNEKNKNNAAGGGGGHKRKD